MIDRPVVISADAAAQRIPAGAGLAIPGNNFRLAPETMLAAIKCRILATGSPQGMTLAAVATHAAVHSSAFATRRETLMRPTTTRMGNSMGRLAALLAALFCVACLSTGSAAAPYPDRPVKLIVPYPAGGSTDGTARLIAQKLSEAWGQAVVVDNRPGADTQIGNAAVASAAPDGYTLLVIATTFAISKSLYPNLPYDPAKDFTPIAPVAIAPFYLLVANNSPAKNVADLIAMAKRDPGKLNYAVSSSTNFIAAESLKQAAGIDVMPIRYKGGAPAVVAVVTGEVNYGMENPLSVQSMLDAGKLRALAVTGERRSALLPSVPTFAELGLGVADIGAWVGLAGPKGTPADVVEKINAAVQAAVVMPDVKQKLDSFMATPIYMNTAQFAAFIKKEFDRYEALVKSNKLTPP